MYYVLYPKPVLLRKNRGVGQFGKLREVAVLGTSPAGI